MFTQVFRDDFDDMLNGFGDLEVRRRVVLGCIR